MSLGAAIVFWSHLLAALALLLSVIYDLGRRLLRKLHAAFSETLDGRSREYR